MKKDERPDLIMGEESSSPSSSGDVDLSSRDSVNSPPKYSPPGFRIQVGEVEIDSGSVPITWCLDPLWLENNKEKLNDYFVHICTFSKSFDGKVTEWRMVPARLTEKMGYVTFLRPGENRIAALVVPQYILGYWLDYSGGEYLEGVIRYPFGGDFPDRDIFCCFYDYFLELDGAFHAYLDVDVPSGVFASRPWKWEEKWVNLFWGPRVVDQCSFRRRRIFAYTIQPALFLLLYSIKLILAIIFLLAGFISKNPMIEGLIHPLIDRGNPFYGAGSAEKEDSIFWRKSFPELWNWANVTSPVFIFISCLLWAFAYPPEVGMFFVLGFLGFWALVYILSFVLGVVTFVLGVVIGFAPSISRLFGNLFLRKGKSEDYVESDLELLSCDNPVEFRRIKDLPKEKRTLKLRFRGVKGRVCRPFSR